MARVLNEQFIRMQKLAGVITEGEYKMKMQEADEQQLEKIVDAVEKDVQNIANDPKKVSQAVAAAKAGGVDMNLVKQAVAQLKQGMDPKDVLLSINKKVESSVSEGATDGLIKEGKWWKELLQKMGIGSAAGGVLMYGAASFVFPAAAPVFILAMVLTGAGAGAAIGAADTDFSDQDKRRIIRQAQDDFVEYQDKFFKETGRELETPATDQIYVVGKGTTPKELEGKELGRRTYGERDAVIDIAAIPTFLEPGDYSETDFYSVRRKMDQDHERRLRNDRRSGN